MPLNQISDINVLIKRYDVYSWLKQYYQGDAHSGKKFIKAAGEYLGMFEALTPELLEVSNYIEGFDFGDLPSSDSVLFDYNKLYVGPGKLLAPPYESAYRNAAGILMQKETLAVRAWYEKVFVKVRDKNILPDDHLGLELEFICYLLAKAGTALVEGGYENARKFLTLYRQFFQEHIRPWIFEHLKDAKKNAETIFCAGVAEFMTSFLRVEEREG